MSARAQDRSVSDVLQDIVVNIQDIVRAEVRLAKAEAREELVNARSAAVIVALGALSGVFAALFALLACAWGLSLVMPPWAAAATVGVVLLISCGILLNAGLTKFRRVVAVPRTSQNIKETVR